MTKMLPGDRLQRRAPARCMGLSVPVIEAIVSGARFRLYSSSRLRIQPITIWRWNHLVRYSFIAMFCWLSIFFSFVSLFDPHALRTICDGDGDWVRPFLGCLGIGGAA